MKFNKFFLLLFATVIVLSGCKKDDDDDDMIVETQTFSVTIENVTPAKDFFQAGVFNTPVGETAPGPALPGNSYTFTFNAGPGHKLSFATMFVQSNDLFYAPDGEGIALFNNGTPVTGDVTSQIQLWDAGTEVNEEPGVGANQAPRQTGPNTGPAENGVVRDISMVNDGFTYPAVASNIKVSIANPSPYTFTVTVENLAASNTPLAPGAYVITGSNDPLFTAGSADLGNGLEGVAEDGAATTLGASVEGNAGLVSPLAPGAFAVHSEAVGPIFSANVADKGQGLEGVAEDGSPVALGAALEAISALTANGVFNTPVGGSAPGPAFPGDSYSFSFTANKGDRLSLATMFVQSNDLFFSPGETGIALWSGDTPISGDITGQFQLWDSGTEVNQFPGAGADQAPRQSGPNVGAAENGVVQLVSDGFTYPGVSDVVRVSISLQ